MVGEDELGEHGVIEQGTFHQLLQLPDGKFKTLVAAQLDEKSNEI